MGAHETTDAKLIGTSDNQRYNDIRDALTAARVYRIPVEVEIRDAVIRGYVTANRCGEVEIVADPDDLSRPLTNPLKGAWVNQDSISRVDSLTTGATMFRMVWL